jgi:hypothetical protein
MYPQNLAAVWSGRALWAGSLWKILETQPGHCCASPFSFEHQHGQQDKEPHGEKRIYPELIKPKKKLLNRPAIHRHLLSSSWLNNKPPLEPFQFSAAEPVD